MNIRSILCPSCGGTLKIENQNQSLVYCQFCGCPIQLETNHNKGYDMEMGRLDARGEMADTILEKMEKIKDVLIRNGEARYNIDYYPGYIEELKNDLSNERKSGWKKYVFKPFGLGLIVLIIGAFTYSGLSEVLPSFLSILCGFLLLLAPIYFPIIGFVFKMKRHNRIKEQIARYQQELADSQRVYEETEEYLKANAEVNIPPLYRTAGAIDYIMKGLKGRVFVSLEQALFKCEEAMRQEELTEMMANY